MEKERNARGRTYMENIIVINISVSGKRLAGARARWRPRMVENRAQEGHPLALWLRTAKLDLKKRKKNKEKKKTARTWGRRDPPINQTK